MARVWTEGWEFGDYVGYCFGGTGTYEVTNVEKRTGSYSAHISNLSISTTYFYVFLETPLSEFYFRTAIWLEDSAAWNANPRIYFDTNSYLYFGTCNRISLVIGGVLVDTGTTALFENIWYLIEIHYKKSATVGACEVRIDGITDPEVEFSGNTGAGTVSQFYFEISGVGLGDNASVYFDDMACNDTSGAVDNSWCGEGKVIVMMPNDDSTPLELNPSAAVHHHLLVDEKPTDSDTTYVEGSVVDEEDRYKLTACGLTDVDINRVWVESRSRKTSADDTKIALVLVPSGGAEVVSSDIELLTTYNIKCLSDEIHENPVDTAPWEVADIDLIEIGPRTR
jgi:hypothetical protein